MIDPIKLAETERLLSQPDAPELANIPLYEGPHMPGVVNMLIMAAQRIARGAVDDGLGMARKALGVEVMDSYIRESTISTITRYASATSDTCLSEMIGYSRNYHENTEEMDLAVVRAVLPLMSDERLNLLMRHIAEVCTNDLDESTEVES